MPRMALRLTPFLSWQFNNGKRIFTSIDMESVMNEAKSFEKDRSLKRVISFTFQYNDSISASTILFITVNPLFFRILILNKSP